MDFLPPVRRNWGQILADPVGSLTVENRLSLCLGLVQDSGPFKKAPQGLGGQLLSFGATFWAKDSVLGFLLANKVKGEMLGGKNSQHTVVTLMNEQLDY